MSSSPRSSFSAPGTPGPETAPTFVDPSQFESKLNAYASHFAAANPSPAVSPQRVAPLTQPLSSVARSSTWQSYFPAPDDDEDIFMSDESVMSMRDRNRARSLPDTTKCLSPSVLTTAALPLQSLSARHSVPSLSSNYAMAAPQQPTLSIPVPPNIPPAPFAARPSVVSLPASSDEEEEDSEVSRWSHRSIKAKPTAKPLKEKAYKCPVCISFGCCFDIVLIRTLEPRLSKVLQEPQRLEVSRHEGHLFSRITVVVSTTSL
jgi:hypothetical protein